MAWRGGREVDGECERRGARESGESGVERQMDTMDIDCKDIDCKDIDCKDMDCKDMDCKDTRST